MCVPLDDQYGGFPRSVYIFADYRTPEKVQTAGRVLRETTISPEETKIRIVYAAQFREETKIVETSVAKSIHAKRAIAGNSGLLLPDDYEVEYIPDYVPPSYELPKLNMASEWDSDQPYTVF
jgi:hypothetical protein